jgi:hypothetical protein
LVLIVVENLNYTNIFLYWYVVINVNTINFILFSHFFGRSSMLRIRNYFITSAVVFAISSAYAVIGVQDVKAQSTMGDLIQRIEALESKGGGNVTAPKVKGLKISGHIRTRFEANADFLKPGGAGTAAPSRQSSGLFTRTLTAPLGGGGDTDETALGVARSHNFVMQRIRLGFDFDINKNVRAHAMIDSNRALVVTRVPYREVLLTLPV